MEALRKLLPKSLERHGITRQVKAVVVWGAFEKISAKYLPPEVAGEVEFISFKKGCLKASVPGPSFSQAVKMQEIKLISELNKSLGAKAVTRIQTVIYEEE